MLVSLQKTNLREKEFVTSLEGSHIEDAHTTALFKAIHRSAVWMVNDKRNDRGFYVQSPFTQLKCVTTCSIWAKTVNKITYA